MKTWKIKPSLTMSTTPDVMKAQQRDIPQKGDWKIDLQQVKQIDSAGAAFLFWCIRQAKRRKLHFSILNVPQDFKPLCEAQGVWSILQEYI